MLPVPPEELPVLPPPELRVCFAMAAAAAFACWALQYAVSVATLVPFRYASWRRTSPCCSCCFCTRSWAPAAAALAVAKVVFVAFVALLRAFSAADCWAARDSTVFWSARASARTVAERSDRCDIVPTR